jgi:hypothetical protein
VLQEEDLIKKAPCPVFRPCSDKDGSSHAVSTVRSDSFPILPARGGSLEGAERRSILGSAGNVQSHRERWWAEGDTSEEGQNSILALGRCSAERASGMDSRKVCHPSAAAFKVQPPENESKAGGEKVVVARHSVLFEAPNKKSVEHRL